MIGPNTPPFPSSVEPETTTTKVYVLQSDPEYTDYIITITTTGLNSKGEIAILRQIINTEFGLLTANCLVQEQARKDQGAKDAASGVKEVGEADKAMDQLKPKP